ncbi:MAG TPA: prepilin peptidase [Steroidobacteraceae bacterium]
MLQVLAQSPALLVGLALLLGLVVGSFLNVVIYRLPIMLEREFRQQCAELNGAAPAAAAAERFDLIAPRSACPACKAPIHAWQNVPLLSWLLLRGRCASCGAPISIRYPLIEMLTATLTALVAWHYGPTSSAASGIIISWFLVALTFIDLDHQLLPDSLTLPLLWLGLVASTMWQAAPDAAVPVAPAAAVLGAACGYLSLWSVYHVFRRLTGKEGMGYGDFKLLGALGAWLGWQMLLPIILAAAAVGALVGVVLIASGRHGRTVPIPFGPFLAAAGWLAMMWGPQWVHLYFGLYGH